MGDHAEAVAELQKEHDEATVTMQMQQFLDEWHYRIIANLSSAWDRPKASESALGLFELRGVPFEPGEKEALVKLEESELIRKVSAKMPDEFKRSFEAFAQQSLLLGTKATSVRKVVDEGNPEGVAAEMDNADSSGIVSQILKASIVQAGLEVSDIRKRHTSWTMNTDNRTARLVRSADEAANAQRQLQAIQMQLASFGSQQNEKSKGMMARVAGNNDKAMIAMVFTSWHAYKEKEKGVKDIRLAFEAEIENLDNKLTEYRAAALNNVRSVLMRKASEGDAALLVSVFKVWWEQNEETKREMGGQAAMNAMEARLQAASASQTENTKKVMARMSAGSDSALLVVVLGSWVKFIEDYKKNKDEEDAVRAQEKAMEEYMKQKKDQAKSVLDKMNSSTDSGLQEHVMSTWIQYRKEEKEAAKMEAIMAEQEAKFGALNGRQKDNAKGVMGRVNEQMDLNVMLRHFSMWATDTKLERIMRHYNSKMDSKKQQLQSVQHLFRNFAQQLDQGLKGDADSARDSGSRRRKDDGGVTLPEIQKK